MEDLLVAIDVLHIQYTVCVARWEEEEDAGGGSHRRSDLRTKGFDLKFAPKLVLLYCTAINIL